MVARHYYGSYEAGSRLLGYRRGLTSVDWSPNGKWWLNLVFRRIHSSRNRTNFTFPRALVVVCALQGIQRMWRRKLSSSERCSTGATRRHSSFPILSLPYASGQGCPCSMPMRYLLPMDPPIHPRLVQACSIYKGKRKRKNKDSSIRRPQF